MNAKRSKTDTFPALVARLLAVRDGQCEEDDDVQDDDPASRAVDKVRDLLESKSAASYATQLETELQTQRGIPARRLGFLLSEYYARIGEPARLKQLFKHQDARFRANVLNGLECAAHGMHADVQVLAVRLALSGLKDKQAKVRATACSLLQNLCESVDVAATLPHVVALLDDSAREVRMLATCAVQSLASANYKLPNCVKALAKNVRLDDGTGEYAAGALARLAEQGVDISPAIADLVWLLEQPHDYSDPVRAGSAALHQCAKLSPKHARRVQEALAKAHFSKKSKLLERFLASVDKLPSA